MLLMYMYCILYIQAQMYMYVCVCVEQHYLLFRKAGKEEEEGAPQRALPPLALYLGPISKG